MQRNKLALALYERENGAKIPAEIPAVRYHRNVASFRRVSTTNEHATIMVSERGKIKSERFNF